MKYISTLIIVFIFSTISAFSQMFVPLTSGEGYSYALDEAANALGDNPELFIIGHFLGSLNLDYGGTPIVMKSAFNLETGKANYWVYSFRKDTKTINIGVLNSPLAGGYNAFDLDLTEYLDIDAMANTEATITTDNMMGSEELNQYFSQNPDFMAKLNNLKENYAEGYMGYYYNGPVEELDQTLYWGFWFIKENRDADICVLDVVTEETECVTYTSVEEQEYNSFSVSPNPATSHIIIDNTVYATEYIISNYYGEIVMEGNISIGQNSLNLSKLSTGFYFLQLSNDNGMVKSEKIIVK